jgi:hypothetical protein
VLKKSPNTTEQDTSGAAPTRHLPPYPAPHRRRSEGLGAGVAPQKMCSILAGVKRHFIAIIFLISCNAVPTFSQQQQQSAQQAAKPNDLNVRLMRTTYMVVGFGKNPGETTLGTAFLVGRRMSAQPKELTTTGHILVLPVLVTAAHVFEEMSGEDALILLRTENAGQWTAMPAHFKIRQGTKPLWTQLQDTDVAAMYVNLPIQQPDVVPMDVLADDEMLKSAEVEPGAQLSILGYPLGQKSNDIGFPILRTGVIASYPLLPTVSTHSFLLDFRVFRGNSGGPVYYSPSVPRGGSFICCPPQFVMGLVSQEQSIAMPYSQLQLSLAKVVHASAIKATIDSLPPPESAERVNIELGAPQVTLPH